MCRHIELEAALGDRPVQRRVVLAGVASQRVDPLVVGEVGELEGQRGVAQFRQRMLEGSVSCLGLQGSEVERFSKTIHYKLKVIVRVFTGALRMAQAPLRTRRRDLRSGK